MNELVPVGPVSPLRQRLIDDMTMRRFSRETQRNYLRDVGRFATWLGRSPHSKRCCQPTSVQGMRSPTRFAG
jgi:integrase/recombinase XerD